MSVQDNLATHAVAAVTLQPPSSHQKRTRNHPSHDVRMMKQISYKACM